MNRITYHNNNFQMKAEKAKQPINFKQYRMIIKYNKEYRFKSLRQAVQHLFHSQQK